MKQSFNLIAYACDMKKYFIWGFPGVGKSVANSKFRIVDADCERFKYVLPPDVPDSPHSPQNTAYTQRDPSFPNNYWDFVHSVDADAVLLNCHINLLNFLYARGCREIGLISGSLHLIPYKGRYDGYRKAVKELGLEEHFSQSSYPVNSFEYGYECTSQLVHETPGLDGILTAVDIQGLGAIRALTDMNIQIPGQVKVISLTGHAVGGMLETSMTSMEMPSHEMGEKAAEMVIGEIEASSDKKPTPRCLAFATTLVEREST